MSEEPSIQPPYFREKPYVGLLSLLGLAMGFSVFVVCFLAVSYALYFMVVDAPNDLQNVIGFWVFWLIMLLFGVSAYNYYPTIWLTEEGIYLSFGRGRRLIPWNDVKSVKNLSTRWQGTLVLVKGLTPLHYMYGNIYFSPAFLIDPSIKEYREVVATIQEQIKLCDKQRATGKNP